MGRNGKRKPKKLPRTIIEEVDKNLVKAATAKASKSQIDISSRLSFPVMKIGHLMESDDDTDDEDTLEFDFRPRKIFLSNSCLVCSRICDPEYLCDNCNMVSYCTDIHRREDVPRHRDLCKVLSDSHGDDRNSLNPEEYRALRIGMINSTETLLKRYLELWEREIILYPRGCFKCHCNSDLHRCPDCKVVFWCQEHNDSHSNWCLQYKIFRKVLLAQTTHGNVEPHIPNVHLTALELSLNNFDSVMSMVYDNSDYFQRMDFYHYTSLSHLASIPLTTLYAFQESHPNWRTLEDLAVHLIGAEFHYEGMNLRVWEKLFLHFLPRLKNFRLFITGPELLLPQVPRDLLEKVKLCPRCKFSGKKIAVSFVPQTLYHDFCSSSNYRKPDITCLFNPGLYRKTGFNGQDTWPNTIFKLCQTKVPILVTAYTEREIPMDIQRIKSLCDIEVILTPRRNPFASLKPDRNFVSDESVPLIYKNYFLSIVKAAD